MRLRVVVTLTIASFGCSFSLAQIGVNTDTVAKSVVFLYSAINNQPDPTRPLGTGFFVQVPLLSNPRQAYTFLVTARHVVDPQWAGCPPHQNSPLVFLRLNKKGWSEDQASSGVVYERLELGSNVSYSTDDSVDVAVIPIVFAITNYEAESIHVAEFADSSITSAIGAGSQVLSAGLLPAFPGIWRNYPVFKFGHVSSKPSERIPVPCAPNEAPRWLRVWLLDASLVPGNSGAPIIQMPQILSGEHAALLGLQSISFMGNDVAGMTPVKYIYEVLEKLALKDADLRLPSQVQDAPKPTPPPNKPN